MFRRVLEQWRRSRNGVDLFVESTCSIARKCPVGAGEIPPRLCQPRISGDREGGGQRDSSRTGAAAVSKITNLHRILGHYKSHLSVANAAWSQTVNSVFGARIRS